MTKLASFVELLMARRAFYLLGTIALCSSIVSCGSDSRKEDRAEVGTTARSLVPRETDFGAGAKSEEWEATSILRVCNLKQMFQDSTSDFAVSPLIRKGKATYVVLVGVFNGEAEATKTHSSLLRSNQRICYVDFIRKAYASQIGRSAVTRSHLDGMERQSASSKSVVIEARTKLHFPSKDYDSDVRLGVLRQGRAIYLIANFRWGWNSVNPLTEFHRILRSRRSH